VPDPSRNEGEESGGDLAAAARDSSMEKLEGAKGQLASSALQTADCRQNKSRSGNRETSSPQQTYFARANDNRIARRAAATLRSVALVFRLHAVHDLRSHHGAVRVFQQELIAVRGCLNVCAARKIFGQRSRSAPQVT